MADLCTQAQVLAQTQVAETDLNLSAADFYTLIDTLIDDVSAEVVSFCDRDFDLHTDATDTFSVGPISERYIEIRGPVISVTKVEITETKGGTFSELDSDYYTVENPGLNSTKADIAYLTRIGEGSVLRQYRGGIQPSYSGHRSTVSRRWRAQWLRGYENIKVTYTYGYSTVPIEIKRIAVRTVCETLQDMVRRRNKRVGSSKSLTAGTNDPSVQLSEESEKALQSWKSVARTHSVV